MSRFINPVPQFFLEDGSVASFGRMYFYENNNLAVLKNTFALPDNTVSNTNPIILTGSGRLPSCYGEGLYSVMFYAGVAEDPDSDGPLIWSRNDVSLSELAGQFELWNSAETYEINDITKDPSDGNYYQLWGASTSKGEQPSTSLTKWELVTFLTGYNNNKPYQEGDNVVFDGYIYRANTSVTGISPPASQWDNLTFNDSIAGDFSVGGGLDVAGNVVTNGTVKINYGTIQIGADGGGKIFIRFDGKISSDDVLFYEIFNSGNSPKISTSFRTSAVSKVTNVTSIDPDLSISSLVAGWYEIEAYMHFTTEGSNTNGIYAQIVKDDGSGFGFPATAGVWEHVEGGILASDSYNNYLNTAVLAYPSNPSANNSLKFKGMVNNDDGSGICITWAQGTLTPANATRVQCGYIKATRLLDM